MDAAVDDGRVGLAGGPALRAARLDGAHDAVRVHVAIRHLAEDDVLAVEPAGDHGGDEELGAVAAGVSHVESGEKNSRVRSSVGHGQEERLLVLQPEVLVGELLSVDGAAASALDC